MVDNAQELNNLVRELAPRLNPGQFVFVTFDDEAKIRDVDIIGSIAETEGLSLIISLQDADRLDAEYQVVLSWITLDVRSSLQAVGLTAHIAQALANQKIACNVVAGTHHDHLFVPKTDTVVAMQILEQLVQHAQR